MGEMSLSIEEYIEIQKQNALEEGREEKQEEIVCRMKRKGMPEQAISEMLDMPMEVVKDLLSEE